MTNRVQLRWMRPFVWLVLLSLGSAVLSAEPSFAQVNQPPRFPASETGTRQVEENKAAGTTVGGPVSAEDPEGAALTYSLSGTDAARFDINSSSGQILTKSVLDYETGFGYVVTVTANDGTTDASIEVQIAVTNVDEPGTLTLSPSDTPRVGRPHLHSNTTSLTSSRNNGWGQSRPAAPVRSPWRSLRLRVADLFDLSEDEVACPAKWRVRPCRWRAWVQVAATVTERRRAAQRCRVVGGCPNWSPSLRTSS